MKKKLTIRNIQALTHASGPFEVFDTEIKGFILRVEPTVGVMTYYLAYKPRSGPKAGQRRRYRIGRTSELTVAQARDEAETLAARVVAGSDPQEEKNVASQDAERAKFNSLRGFLEHKYIPWVVPARKTGDETVQRIKTQFEDLLDRPLNEISQWVIEKWRSERIKQGISPSTINRDVVALKAAISKAVEWDIIEHHPLEKVKPLKTDTRGKVRYLSEAEYKRLRKALSDRDEQLKVDRESGNRWRRERGYPIYPDLRKHTYADYLTPMVLLTLNTGLRRGEVFSLKWENVNFRTKTVTIEGGDAKSGLTRHIALNEEAIAALKDWKKKAQSSGLVFPGKDGKRLGNVRKVWTNILKSAKIQNFRWHDMRHDFASRLVMNGTPLNTVRELLGHSNLVTTLRYAHLAPDHKAEAVARLNRI